MTNDQLIRRLTPATIASLASRAAFNRGQEYWASRHVLSLACEDETDGVSVAATVRGSQWQQYEVTVSLIDGGLDRCAIFADCTCPVGIDCKHVVAALLAVSSEAARRPVPFPSLRVQAPHAPGPPPPLPSNVLGWVDRLALLEQTEGEEYPALIRERLVYVISLQKFPIALPQLTVSPMSTRLLKDGSISVKARRYDPSNVRQGMPARYLRPSDRAILQGLIADYGQQQRGLAGERGVALLEAMIETGRARWQSIDGVPLTRGPALSARFIWQLADDAAQHLTIEIDGDEALRATPLAPPWYVDEANGVVGPLDTGLNPKLAATLLEAPPLSPGQEAQLRQALATRAPALAALAPPTLPPSTTISDPVVPHLALVVTELPRAYGPSTPVPAGRLSFRYGPIELSDRDGRPRALAVKDGRLFEITRDRVREREAEQQLRALGFSRLSALYGSTYGILDEFSLPQVPGYENWLDFLYRGAPALREAGWAVDVDPAFPIRLVRADGPVDAHLRRGEGTGIDWLDLDLGIVIDDRRVEITEPLLDIILDPEFDPLLLAGPLDEDAVVYLPLPGGQTLAVPAGRLRAIVSALYELFAAGLVDARQKTVRLSRFDAADLARAEEITAEDGVRWRGGEALRQLGARLRAAGGIPHVDLPPSFVGTLRPYQAAGVDWLQFLREGGFGAILADDMGLGKTVQALAHITIEKAAGRLDRPALVVAPTSVLQNWRSEAARFAPGLRVLVLHGPARAGLFTEIDSADLVITSYPLLTRDRDTLKAHEWHFVLLDEAQAIKNPDALAARAARELNVRQRLCLTGTPIENHLGELWSQFAFLAPGFLGDRQSFYHTWRRPIEINGDEARRLQLARRVRPFLLRRTKSEVATELPEKTEIVESVEMDRTQRDLYESIRLAMHERVRDAIARRGLARSQVVLLDALLKLRQACCDPRLLKLKAARTARARSAKFDRLMEMLPPLLDEGRHILLFSQFTSMLALIRQAFDEAGTPYVVLTGDTRDRQTPIEAFQSGRVPLFLVSLKAGGVGLNLTAADTVIHYDPWWNPAVEEQATDRAHRIGQQKPVFVHRLVTLGSIEEKMEDLKARKRLLAASLFEPDGRSALHLTEADVEALFAPA